MDFTEAESDEEYRKELENLAEEKATSLFTICLKILIQLVIVKYITIIEKVIGFKYI